MKNLFDAASAAELISRIQKLEPTSKALWGKMNVAQMLSYIQVPMGVALGDRNLKRSLPGILFGRIAKKRLINDKPFPVNLPTDPSFVMKGVYDFNTEKQKAVVLLNRLVTAGEAGISNLPHPFFGKMTVGECGILTAKHLDHHLRQFGI